MACLVSGWKPSHLDVSGLVYPSSRSPSPSSHTVQSAITPKRGQPGYIKRPRNSFIIFRCEFVQKNRGTAAPNGDRYKRLSKRASEAWLKLGKQERAKYVRLSELEKEEHARQHPDYVYRPNKKRRNGNSAAGSTSMRPLRQQQVHDFLQRRSADTVSVSAAPSPCSSNSTTQLSVDAISRQSSLTSTHIPYSQSALSTRSCSPSWDCDTQSSGMFGSEIPMTPSEGCDPAYGPSFYVAENAEETATYGVAGLITATLFSQDRSDASYCSPLHLQDTFFAPPTPVDSPFFPSSSPASSLANWIGEAHSGMSSPPSWFSDTSSSTLGYLAEEQPFLYAPIPSEVIPTHDLVQMAAVEPYAHPEPASSQYAGGYSAEMYIDPSANFVPTL